ncbi:HNH endonuclease [Branchiibius hedensis]|uniref:HNH endonuclease n=1 Tax=Branchiibius hedensis TaxID=672460 RepID=A0A2Y8ZLW7_9MICO|nr:HNH endonuclease signature motif containing protein [Branchiibius hedensis]PWJ22819.1 HNH endonuclease [Branchiibius hedensis]PWJ23936.1 HNH endonuclease [Branchiibius hedensis]SSA32754.1 HNH endonuclease [Branchiibius hedensis]SSA59168.1 HNH endonuclease [Branchiibius hedensis]
MTDTTCKQDGCERPTIARGLCTKHYDRARNVGDIEFGPRTRGRAGLTHAEIFAVTPKCVTSTGCIEWDGHRSQYQYGIIQSKSFGNRGAHRVAMDMALGERVPDELHVCHRCDNPPCVNPEHLFLGDDLVNVADMIDKGRHAHGERGGGSKLREDQVVEIINRYAAGGIGRPALAREYGVSPACIQKITEGKMWRHLPRPARPQNAPSA